MQVVELPCLVKSAPNHVIACACDLIRELNDLSTDGKVAVIVDQAYRDHKIATFLFVIIMVACFRKSDFKYNFF